MNRPSHTSFGSTVLLLLALAVASSAVLAASNCKKVSGKFVLEAQTGSACTSPVGICMTGSYSGSLAGQSAFIGSNSVQTVDTPTTSVVLITGDTEIQANGRTLRTKDAMVLKSTGAGDMAAVNTVIGGTGEWAGTTGTIRTQGTFTSAGGAGAYIGELCTP